MKRRSTPIWSSTSPASAAGSDGRQAGDARPGFSRSRGKRRFESRPSRFAPGLSGDSDGRSRQLARPGFSRSRGKTNPRLTERASFASAQSDKNEEARRQSRRTAKSPLVRLLAPAVSVATFIRWQNNRPCFLHKTAARSPSRKFAILLLSCESRGEAEGPLTTSKRDKERVTTRTCSFNGNDQFLRRATCPARGAHG